MRQIGHLENESAARAFSDYLYVQGIKNQIEAEKDASWAIWVHAEEEMERARQLLAEYRINRNDPKFENARKVAPKLKEQEEKELADYRKRIQNRRHLFRPLTTYGFGPLTFAMIFISVVVFVLSKMGKDPMPIMGLFITQFDINSHHGLRDLPEIRQGEVWRVFTPIFIHFNILHILFNMLWLRDLGSMIEARQSTWHLAILALAVAAGSNVAQYFASGNPVFGGMSGVVYGLLGYIWIRGKFDPASGLFLHQSTVTMMIVWFFLCYTGLLGNIANTAHAVGLGMGMAWGYFSSLVRR